MPFPTPDTEFPITYPDGSTFPGTVFLNAILDHPSLQIGDYTYHSDMSLPDTPDGIRNKLFPYLFGEQSVTIGKFCSIAEGTEFITSGANHRYDGFSAYPFAIFDGMSPDRPSMPSGARAHMEIGHDVWFGRDAKVLPGTTIGTGSIIGTNAVAGGDIPPYSVVVGNPGKVIRTRFDPATVDTLLEIAWWDWPIEKILSHEAEICGADLQALLAAS